MGLLNWLFGEQKKAAKPVAKLQFSMEDMALLTDGQMETESLLGLAPPIDPTKSKEVIDKFLVDYFAGKDQRQLDPNTAAFLGVFWGFTIMQAFNWDWTAVAVANQRRLGITDKENRYLALPINYLHKMFSDDPKHEMRLPSSYFDAIAANQLPESRPGLFTIVME